MRTAVLGTDLLQQGTHAGANAEGLARNDLVAGQQRLGVVAEIDDDVVAGDLLHGTGNDLADLLAVGIDHLGALGLADLLHDDLLGSLRSDAAELDGFDLFFDDLADLRARLLLLDVLDGDLGGGVLVVLVGDDVPTTESLVAAVMTIDLDAQVDLVLETFLGGGRQSQLQRLENHAGRYALSLDTDSTTSSTSLLIVRLAFQSIGSADSRLNQNGE